MHIVEIQDNKRETELISKFGLIKTNHSRIGIDAKTIVDGKEIHFEIKSTTMGAVSTASPLSLDHIIKWKKCHWIIGIYNKKAELEYCVYGSPDDMDQWLTYWEEDIKRGLLISDMLVDRIDNKMVDVVFGKKNIYSYDDAVFVYKNLYSQKEYKKLKDIKNGYSRSRMLEMFKEHNKTYLYRGSSINNPKIPKKYYSSWTKITNRKELKEAIRESSKQCL